MKKGKLKITPKSGYIKIKGDRVSLKKEMPHIGEGKEFHNMECEYEGNPATKVIVAGKTFSVDTEAIEAEKSQKEEQKRKEEQRKEIARAQEQSNDSFVLSKTRTPLDTRNCLIDNPDNFSLKLNQFARFDDSDEKFLFFDSDKRNGYKIKPNFGTLFKNNKQLSNKILESAKCWMGNEGHISTAYFKPNWRFVVGLGGDSVYETGMTLHHIYGIPFIPASSIKGVLRTWIIQSCFDNNESQALECETFCCVFGTQKKRGNVTFFDALPTSEPKIEPDIMNPHYGEWYSGKEGTRPLDTDKPNPIFFLTVKNTSFQFIMASKEINIENEMLWNNHNLNWWLESALSAHGIGAKTAVGYGYMNRG